MIISNLFKESLLNSPRPSLVEEQLGADCDSLLDVMEGSWLEWLELEELPPWVTRSKPGLSNFTAETPEMVGASGDEAAGGGGKFQLKMEPAGFCWERAKFEK